MRTTKCLAAALVFAAGLVLPSIGYSAESDSSDSAKKSKSSADDRSDSQKQSRNQQNSDDDAQHHAALGVSLTESDGQVKVVAVLPGSPAARAGLQVGDQIRYVGDQRIRTAAGLAEEIGEYHPGSQVELSIRRDGEKKTLQARLASQESTFSSRDRRNRNVSNQSGGNNDRQTSDRQTSDRQGNQAQRAAYSYGGNEDQQNASMLSQQVRTLQQQVSRLQQEVNELRMDQSGNRNRSTQNRDTRSTDGSGQSYRTTSRQQYDDND